MKVLLVGEASRVHRNLKIGLQHLGSEVLHLVQTDPITWREWDGTFAPNWTGIKGGLARNLAPFVKIAGLGKFDVINFTNTLTAVVGMHSKYYDLPLFRSKARLMSYYALGCDEIGLIRRNHELPYAPCATCLSSGEMLGRVCEEYFNPRFERSVELTRKYFDFGACSMMEYSAAQAGFSSKLEPIQFPLDVSRIAFAPAQARQRVRIVHTPTRRGFKGTDVVIEAISQLGRKRTDFEFSILEGLSFDEYLTQVNRADVVIDQVYSQSPGMNGLEQMAAGKIVLTGATPMGRAYFPFMSEMPAFDASPDPAILAKTLEEILDRRDEFPALAVNGRSYVEANHDLVRVAQLFMSAWKARL